MKFFKTFLKNFSVIILPGIPFIFTIIFELNFKITIMLILLSLITSLTISIKKTKEMKQMKKLSSLTDSIINFRTTYHDFYMAVINPYIVEKKTVTSENLENKLKDIYTKIYIESDIIEKEQILGFFCDKMISVQAMKDIQENKISDQQRVIQLLQKTNPMNDDHEYQRIFDLIKNRAEELINE